MKGCQLLKGQGSISRFGRKKLDFIGRDFHVQSTRSGTWIWICSWFDRLASMGNLGVPGWLTLNFLEILELSSATLDWIPFLSISLCRFYPIFRRFLDRLIHLLSCPTSVVKNLTCSCANLSNQAAAIKAEANKAFSSKDYPSATKLYSDAIAVDPTNHVLFSNRSASKAGQKDWRGALDDAEKVGWSR